MPSNASKKPSNLRTEWQRKWLGLVATAPQVQAMADAVETWCLDVARGPAHGRLLVLTGPSGVGKTACLRRMARWVRAVAIALYERGRWPPGPAGCELVFWSDIAEEIRAGWGGLLSQAASTDILLLDDIGAEDDPWKKATARLSELLNKRERKFTAVTTNIAPAAWEQRFDSRVADRLLRNSTVVDLAGAESWATR